MKYIIYELRKWNENEEMIVAVDAIYAIPLRSLKKIQDFNGFWTRNLTWPYIIKSQCL